MFKRQKAFTLSELLVSLAVLGLIAAISIPSVYNSVKEQREKAVWKETISTLSTLYMEGAMEGHTNSALNQYLLNHVNASKLCPTNVSTEGCYAFDDPSDAGFELPNGAVVNAISGGGATDNFRIDINGAAGPNNDFEDRLRFVVCLDEGCSLSRPIIGRVAPFNASYAAMYNEFFGVN